MPGLVNEIRNETRAFCEDTKWQTGVRKDANKANENSADLGASCPVFKACYLGTLRMNGEIRSIRKLKATSSFQIGEAVANITHAVKAGDYIYAFHYLHHGDPKYFEDLGT